MSAQMPHRSKSTVCALYHAFVWTCRLLIKQAQLDLAGKDQDSRHWSDVADSNAEHIVKTIPFLWAAASGQSGKALNTRGTFHIVIEWYEHSGNETMLEHCKETERNCREESRFLQWDAFVSYGHGLLY